MGKFGCTQIQTSSSCSSEKKKDFFYFFLWGGWISCSEVWSAFWQKRPKRFFDPFFNPPGDILAKTWGYRGELGRVFGSNFPLALLIDPWKWLVDAPKWKTKPPIKLNHKIGQNRNAKVACTRALMCNGANFFTISSKLKFHVGLPKNHQNPTNRCREIC